LVKRNDEYILKRDFGGTRLYSSFLSVMRKSGQ